MHVYMHQKMILKRTW